MSGVWGLWGLARARAGPGATRRPPACYLYVCMRRRATPATADGSSVMHNGNVDMHETRDVPGIASHGAIRRYSEQAHHILCGAIAGVSRRGNPGQRHKPSRPDRRHRPMRTSGHTDVAIHRRMSVSHAGSGRPLCPSIASPDGVHGFESQQRIRTLCRPPEHRSVYTFKYRSPIPLFHIAENPASRLTMAAIQHQFVKREVASAARLPLSKCNNSIPSYSPPPSRNT